MLLLLACTYNYGDVTFEAAPVEGDAGGDTAANTDAGRDTASATDTASDTDTQSDTGTDTAGSDDPGAPLDALVAYDLAYSFDWDFDDAYGSYLEAYGLADCVTTYAGSGIVYERVATRLTFYGPWAPSGTTCNAALVDVLWYDDARDSYASFSFGEDLSTLDDWVQHLDAANHEPVDEPSAHKQWYITEMYADFDLEGGTVHYELEESITVDIIPVLITHTLDVSFAR